MLFNHKKHPARMLADCFTKAPDDYVALATSKNPMSLVQVDETGPIVISTEAGDKEVYLLCCVELVTRKAYIIPQQAMDTTSFLQSLEILNNRRGIMTHIVVDKATSHENIANNPNAIDIEPGLKVTKLTPTLHDLLRKKDQNFLSERGITVVIADGKNHKMLGLAETLVKNIKHSVIDLFSTLRTRSFFDLQHRVAILEHWINSRPTLNETSRILNPNSLEEAALRRAYSATDAPVLLSEYILPTAKNLRIAVQLLATDSRHILDEYRANLATRILNSKNQKSDITVGDLIYVIDRITEKDVTSLKDCLGRVIASRKDRSVLIKLSNGKSITRRFDSIVRANYAGQDKERIDLLDYPLYSNTEAKRFDEKLWSSQFEIPFTVLDETQPEAENEITYRSRLDRNDYGSDTDDDSDDSDDPAWKPSDADSNSDSE